MQNGREVTVICAGIPVFFEDCSPSPDARDIIFYDPGPAAFNPTNYDESKFIRKGSDGRYQHTYTQPGTYTVTQIINKHSGGGTTTFAHTFEVKIAPAPTFSLTVCANRSVQIDITDTYYNHFDIDYGDGTIRQNVEGGIQPLYTYTGTTTSIAIKVTGKFTGGSCQNSGTQGITLLPVPPVPLISRLEVITEAAAGEISLSIQSLQPGYAYVVERLSPSGQYESVATTEQTTQNSLSNFRISGINTAEATRYRVRPVDNCETSLNIISAPVSSIALGVKPGEEQATLSWTGDNTTVERYDIIRNGNTVQSIGRTVRTYTDNGLICGQNYCYQITGIDRNGVSVSISAQGCVQVNSSAAPPVGYLYTSYDRDNQVQLMLTLPKGQEAKQVRYQRSIDGAPATTITTSGQTQYTDQLQAPTAVCYRAAYTNPCNRESNLSNTSCPVYLIVLPQENAPVLTLGWTGYVGFPDGVGSYTVEQLDQNGQILNSYPAKGNTYIDRNLPEEVQELRYRIKVTSGNGSVTSYSNTETVKQPLQVHVPTAFTPNGDGLNDVLEVKGRFIRDYRITVYNSMGQVVFSSTDRSTSWNGTYRGKPQPAGAYAYEINIITTNGEEKQRTGTVTLLR